MLNNKNLNQLKAGQPRASVESDEVLNHSIATGKPTDWDPSMLLEYREAVVMINSIQGQLQIQVAAQSLVGRADEGLPASQQSKVWQSDILPVQANLPIPEVTAPTGTFSDLVERFSSQMQQVMASGKQITAATKRMSEGVQEMNEGVGSLKQKLTRVKY